MNEFSFNKGWSQLKLSDLKDVKDEIMDVLHISHPLTFRKRRSGEIEPKVSEARAIEAIFAKRGINEVWGPA